MRKLLVANRGEISVRIQRTARALGYRTVAVYSEADANALHVAVADEAYLLGAAPALESYLRVDKLIDVAQRCGADLVHPGYGFLSENAEFAQALADAGITFVGPSAAAIRAMGSKIEAKNTVAAAGTPVVPGYQGDDQSDAVLEHEAERIGCPLLIKASAGGGGKGMRLVNAPEEFADALKGARREAQSAFGDDRVLLERYLTAPKHIEVQIVADTHGNTVHLFERDCSVQRRHQKVIEEAPAPGVDDALRERLGSAAVTAARSIDYVGAGTVEFIAEGDEFYFMEMNTRLQVEHPVTEAITGVDLVAVQLAVAEGDRLPFAQTDLAIHGHAVEARVYAENPRKRFLPSTGLLHRVHFPDTVRVDSGVRTGDSVSMHYDPMLAKVIAHGDTRAEAFARLSRALSETEIVGVQHNVGYLVKALGSEPILDGGYTTGFADQEHDALTELDVAPYLAAATAAAAAVAAGQADALAQPDGFQLNQPALVRAEFDHQKTRHVVEIYDSLVTVNGEAQDIQVVASCSDQVKLVVHGARLHAAVYQHGAALTVTINGDAVQLTDVMADINRFSVGAVSGDSIVSPLPGQVLEVPVKAGDRVRAGAVVAVVEAMKMEHSVKAPRAGVVKSVLHAAGARVEEGAELIVLEE